MALNQRFVCCAGLETVRDALGIVQDSGRAAADIAGLRRRQIEPTKQTVSLQQRDSNEQASHGVPQTGPVSTPVAANSA
jgi:hypothetical protein